MSATMSSSMSAQVQINMSPTSGGRKPKEKYEPAVVYGDFNAVSASDCDRPDSADELVQDMLRSQRELAAEEKAPKDHMHMCAIILFVQGAGMLFPWNTVLTITTYWSWELKDSSFEANYTNYFEFIFSAILVIVSLIFTRVQHRLSMNDRVLHPLLVQLAVYIILIVLVYIKTAVDDVFFGIMIFLIIVLGLCVGFNQPGVYTVASNLPSRFQKYPVQGEAWAGVAVALINIITLGASSSVEAAATAFFAVSIFIIIVCILCYTYLVNCAYFHYWRNFYQSVDMTNAAMEAELARDQLEDPEDYEEITWDQYCGIVKKVRYMAFSVWFLFTTTLLVFPVLPLSVVPYHHGPSRFYTDLWLPVYTFLFFNVSDMLGRSLGQFFICPRSWVPYLSLGRIIFLPLFVFCNNRCFDESTKSLVAMRLPVGFKSDAAPIIFMLAFGFSNGYIFNAIMYHTPNIVKGSERAVGCSLVISMLILGLLTGAITSFGSKAIICPQG